MRSARQTAVRDEVPTSSGMNSRRASCLRFERTEREREALAEKELDVHVLACMQLLMSYTALSE